MLSHHSFIIFYSIIGNTNEQKNLEWELLGDKNSLDGLVQERRNSIANALELHLFSVTHRFDIISCLCYSVSSSLWYQIHLDLYNDTTG